MAGAGATWSTSKGQAGPGAGVPRGADSQSDLVWSIFTGEKTHPGPATCGEFPASEVRARPASGLRHPCYGKFFP